MHARHSYHLSTCEPCVGLDTPRFGNKADARIAASTRPALFEFPGSMSFYTPHLNDFECNQWAFMPIKNYTTFSNGSLGSRIDEERSEMR